MKNAITTMISESVYYMDRGRNVLVTDHQVVVSGKRYDLALVKDARIVSKHSGDTCLCEIYVRIASMAALLGAMAIRGFFWQSDLGQALFQIDIMLLTGGLVAMLLFGVMARSRRVVVLRRLNGRTEELFECLDTHYASEFIEAVTEAASDLRAGHGGNARGVYRRRK